MPPDRSNKSSNSGSSRPPRSLDYSHLPDSNIRRQLESTAEAPRAAEAQRRAADQQRHAAEMQRQYLEGLLEPSDIKVGPSGPRRQINSARGVAPVGSDVIWPSGESVWVAGDVTAGSSVVGGGMVGGWQGGQRAPSASQGRVEPIQPQDRDAVGTLPPLGPAAWRRERGLNGAGGYQLRGGQQWQREREYQGQWGRSGTVGGPGTSRLHQETGRSVPLSQVDTTSSAPKTEVAAGSASQRGSASGPGSKAKRGKPLEHIGKIAFQTRKAKRVAKLEAETAVAANTDTDVGTIVKDDAESSGGASFKAQASGSSGGGGGSIEGRKRKREDGSSSRDAKKRRE